MRAEGRLTIAAGFATDTGARSDNQDFGVVHLGSATEQATHGILAVIADGVGGAKGGRIASELASRSLVDGFYAAPVTIGSVQAAEQVLGAFNAWLHAQARNEALLGAATTLTALILKGRRAHVVHVGDSRAWHFREGRLRCLTDDHVLRPADLRHVLYRAVGIEQQLRLDHAHVELAPHDRLLLTTDGVHDVLSAERLSRLLAARNSAETDSAEIVRTAIEARTQDNATAIVIDIVALPAPDYEGLTAELATLPILPPPQEGELIDGFRLLERVADGRYARIFRATDEDTKGTVAVKFPKTSLLSERAARLAFTREALIGRRITSPFVGGALAVGPERQSRLYNLQPFYAGETMLTRLSRSLPSMEEAVERTVQLTRAVAALHRLDVIHRDIKPENVMLTSDGGLKLLDLGAARLPRTEDFLPDEIPGTPGFMAPEQFAGNAGDALTDQFALGVTLYRWLTGKWPYGEQEPFSRPRFGTAPPPSVHRPEVPGWLDSAILQAITPEPTERHGDVIELLRLLEGGGALARPVIRTRAPLIERNPERFWQIVAMLLAAALIASLATG